MNASIDLTKNSVISVALKNNCGYKSATTVEPKQQQLFRASFPSRFSIASMKKPTTHSQRFQTHDPYSSNSQEETLKVEIANNRLKFLNQKTLLNYIAVHQSQHKRGVTVLVTPGQQRHFCGQGHKR